MINKFISNYLKNKIYIILIILVGIFFSILFSNIIKTHYKGTVKLQMAYLESKRFFVNEKLLIYPLKGHNIFLMEKLHRDVLRNRIKTDNDCFKGSVFDDSNEFSLKRNRLGFAPGYDFKLSRTDFELTIIYRDSTNNVKRCIESFVNGFTLYQEKMYQDHLDAQKKVFLFVAENTEKFYSFLTMYAKKYNLNQYQENWNSQSLDEEMVKKIEEVGADMNIAAMYFGIVEKLSRSGVEKEFYNKYDAKIIGALKVEELTNQKFRIIVIINVIFFLFTLIFVIIKEYDY